MKENSICKTWADGRKWWYLNGKRHREGGPAYEGANGTKWWYLNGERHREDGPAIEWADGSKFWYLNGRKLTTEDRLQAAKDKNDESQIQDIIWNITE